MLHHLDVLTVTDCRLPGGTASSTAEEINAQAGTLLTSGLWHVDSPLVSRTRPLNARLRRQIDLGHVTNVLPTDRVECDLVVIRHPNVALAIDPARAPAVRAAQCIVIVNQVPNVDGNDVYDLSQAMNAVERWLSIRPRVAPIGPLVREAIVQHDPALELEADDWVNVIDAEAWSSRRHRRPRDPIVIGRHSRDHYIKFPETRQDLLAAYPSSSGFTVRMLGGTAQVARLLGDAVPRTWEVLEFDAVDPKRFLDDLDVYAYFHHPSLVEAFGRNMLEALAMGVPVVTHHHFAPLFGDAIVTASPTAAPEAIRDLAGDPQWYGEQVERGRHLARTRFGYGVHHARLEHLLGRPVLPRPAAAAARDAQPAKPTALYIGPNGAGLGHLTRLMAIAGHARQRWDPFVFTFSTAAETVRQQGFPVDYFPSRSVTGSTSVAWHAALAERLDGLLTSLQPAVVVIDSTEPYRGILRCLCDHPEIPVVWSRRGMWKPGVTNSVLESGEAFFDLVIEPGDLARDGDRGQTRASATARLIPPVTLLDPAEIDSRDVARRSLGLADDDVAVLVQLGAGAINDTTEILRSAIDALAEVDRARVFVVRAPIAALGPLDAARVDMLDVYPLARIMRAFDLSVAAAGYNTFHELLGAGVPTVFVPNTDTITDDQAARAAWANAQGLALVPDSDDPSAVGLAVKHLAIEANRRAVLAQLQQLDWQSGADEAVRVIDEAVRAFAEDDEPARRRRRSEAYDAVERSVETRAARKRSRAAARRLRTTRASALRPVRSAATRVMRRARRWAVQRFGHQRLAALYSLLPVRLQSRLERWTNLTPGRLPADPTLLRIPPGLLLGEVDESRLASILFVVHPDVANDELTEAIAQVQSMMRNFKPLFLTSSLHATGFRRHGYAWEHDLRPEHPHGAADPSPAASARTRLDEILRRYRPDLVLEVHELADVTAPHSPLRAWLRSRPIT